MNTRDIISVIANIRERANRLIIAELEKCGACGIVPSHGDILSALMGRSRMTMKEIAEKIDRDKSTVTVLVNKLLQLGYVTKERDSSDNRVSFVRLTAQGEALKPAFAEISERLIARVYEGMTEAEQECLLLLLKKVRHNLS